MMDRRRDGLELLKRDIEKLPAATVAAILAQAKFQLMAKHARL